MISEEHLSDVTLKLSKGSGCGVRLLTLSSIPVALFLFSIFGFVGLINFNIEIHSVLMMGIIFVIYLGFMQHNAYYASCKLRRNFVHVKEELIEFINKNMLSIAGVKKANASLDDFLHNSSKHLRNENFSSVAAGIFPTLGILGTFISIAISMPDFSAQTSEVLEQEISKLLGGVGTAFYVSIYGIFLSIWWIFFEKSGASRFQSDALFIKEETKEFFWQKEEIEQTYFKKSMENFEKLNSVFDTFASGNFAQNLNRTLEQRMNIFEKIIEHEQEASTKVATILQNATNDVQLLTNEQNRLTTSLHSVIDTFETFALKIEEHNSSFTKAHASLSAEFSKAVHVAEVLSENSAKLSSTLSNLNNENIQNLYSGVLHNIDALKKEIDSLGLGFEKRVDDFDAKFLDKLQNTLKLIDSETAQIVSKIAQLKQNGK